MKKSNTVLILLTLPLLIGCGEGQSSNSNTTLNPSTSSSEISSNSSSSSEPSETSSHNSSTEEPSEGISSESSESSSETSTSESNTSSSSSSSSSSEEKPDYDVPVIDYVVVIAPKIYTHIYAWEGDSTPILGSWPGALMKPYNDNYNIYDFPGKTALKCVLSVGSNQNQTSDLTINYAGYYMYDVSSQGLIKLGDDPIPDPNPDEGEGNTPDLIEPVEANSWQQFKLWNEYPSSHWKTINKYKGNRKDFRNESIYFAMTTRFYDGDKSNNVQCWDGHNPSSDPAWRGDFKGLIEKMDYIKALGFTAIWITPIVTNCSGYDYHGYHAMDFSTVDERYLSQDVSFQSVINEAHKRDMKIVLDVVFNHTGNFGENNLFPMFTKSGDLSSVDCLKLHPQSVLPKDYFSKPINTHYGIRINAMKSDDKDINHIYHHSKDMSWEQPSEQTGQIAGDCVDLNTENPIVAEYLIRCYGEFIKMGVDAFRVDTVKHISRLTFNNYLLPAFYEYAHRCGNDNFFMFGEVCTRVREVWNHNIPALSAPFYTWKETKQYPWSDHKTNLDSTQVFYQDHASVHNEPTSNNAKLNGLTYHEPDHKGFSGLSVIDFPMHWNFQYARDAFRVGVSNDQYYNDSTYNVVYVDSHDYGPDCIEKTRYSMGTDAWAENLSLMFTFRGIPCIYYGSEIEFKNNVPLDVGPNAPLEDTGRAYYGEHIKGNVVANGFGDYTASGNVAKTLNSTLSKHLIKLNQIRQAVPALSMGQYTTKNVNGEMAYIRRYTKGSIDSLALCSVSGSASFSGIPNGNYVDLVSGDRKVVTSNSLQTGVIGKGNLRVYVLENASTGMLKQIGGSLTYLK